MGFEDRDKPQIFRGAYKSVIGLAIGGALAFWVATFAISLTSLAADYRAAESIASIQTVWVGGLIMGIILGFLLSYSLVRLFDKVPAKNPFMKSLVLSFIALIIILILIEVPASLRTSDPLYYLLVGVILNVPRFLFAGIIIGYLYGQVPTTA